MNSMYLCIYLLSSILSKYLSVCPFTHSFIRQALSSSIHQTVFLSIHRCMDPSIHSSTHPLINPLNHPTCSLPFIFPSNLPKVKGSPKHRNVTWKSSLVVCTFTKRPIHRTHPTNVYSHFSSTLYIFFYFLPTMRPGLRYINDWHIYFSSSSSVPGRGAKTMLWWITLSHFLSGLFTLKCVVTVFWNTGLNSLTLSFSLTVTLIY